MEASLECSNVLGLALASDMGVVGLEIGRKRERFQGWWWRHVCLLGWRCRLPLSSASSRAQPKQSVPEVRLVERLHAEKVLVLRGCIWGTK